MPVVSLLKQIRAAGLRICSPPQRWYKRKYSDMGTANVVNINNPDTSLTFNCPVNCLKTSWLVVSGAPQEHWRHPWDDNNTNDEHWPYQVQFKNTNLLGKTTGSGFYIEKRYFSNVSKYFCKKYLSASKN